MSAAGERVREYSSTGRVSADYLFYPDERVRSVGEELRRSLSCPVHFDAQAKAMLGRISGQDTNRRPDSRARSAIRVAPS